MRLLCLSLIMLSTSCGEQPKFQLGGAEYCIPEKYLLREPLNVSLIAEQLDPGGEILALRFSTADDLSLRSSAKEEITAILFGRSTIGSEAALIAAYEAGPTDDYDPLFDIGNGFRAFEQLGARRWTLVPKIGLDRYKEGTGVEAKWIAKCRASGISTLEADPMKVPSADTSCDTLVLYDEYVLKFTTSEQELLENYDVIKENIDRKLQAWRCN